MFKYIKITKTYIFFIKIIKAVTKKTTYIVTINRETVEEDDVDDVN